MTVIEPGVYQTLSAMISPALFMTATGSLVISTSNRMSRIVDRIRVLNDLSDSLCRGASTLDFQAHRIDHVTDQIHRLEWRSDRIRYALGMLYLALCLFVGSSLTLALDVQLKHLIHFVPTSFAVGGTLLMLAACVNMFREVIEALRSNRTEIQFYRDLQTNRKLSGDLSPPG